MKRVTLIPTSTVDHTPFLCLFRHDNRCVGEPESGVRQSGFELLVIKGYNVAYNPSHVRVTKLNMYQHFNPEQSHLTVPFGGLLAFEYDYTVLLARWLAMNGPGKLKVMAGEEITDCTIGTVRRWIQGGWGCLRR